MPTSRPGERGGQPRRPAGLRNHHDRAADGASSSVLPTSAAICRAVIHGQIRRRVAADRHEAGVADRELPGQAVDQVQADGQGDVDADQVDDAGVVRIDLKVAEAVLEDLVQDEQDARPWRR